jgi:hypothetical protein
MTIDETLRHPCGPGDNTEEEQSSTISGCVRFTRLHSMVGPVPANVMPLSRGISHAKE